MKQEEPPALEKKASPTPAVPAPKTKKKKSATSPHPTPVPEPLPEVKEEKVETTVEKVSKRQKIFDVLTAELKEVSGILQNNSEVHKDNKEATKQFKVLTKKVQKITTELSKLNKTKDKRTTRPHSGFLKPIQVSQEMLQFTGWKEDEVHSRSDITNYLCEYIKKKELQDSADKRVIHPDDSLGQLLRYDSEVHPPLTYPRLQQYIKLHVLKPEAVVEA